MSINVIVDPVSYTHLPLNKVNALLSFVYTLLSHDCASALESVGLD